MEGDWLACGSIHLRTRRFSPGERLDMGFPCQTLMDLMF